MPMWQGEPRWRMVNAFDKEADRLASQPQGMLILVDSATGEQRPVFIQKWDVIRHAGEPLTLCLEVQVVQAMPQDIDCPTSRIEPHASGA